MPLRGASAARCSYKKIPPREGEFFFLAAGIQPSALAEVSALQPRATAGIAGGGGRLIPDGGPLTVKRHTVTEFKVAADHIGGAGRAHLGSLKPQVQGGIDIAAVIGGGRRDIETVGALATAGAVHRRKKGGSRLAVGARHVGKEGAGADKIPSDADAVEVAGGKVEPCGIAPRRDRLTVGTGGGTRVGITADALLQAIAEVGKRGGVTEGGGILIERKGLADITGAPSTARL